MVRNLALMTALATIAAPAMAQDYASNPELITFQGSEGVVNQTYEFPLIVNVGFIIDDIGVIARATAGSNLGIEMEGESNVEWPDPNGGGDVLQYIEPLSGGSRIAMTADVDVGVDFQITVFGQRFTFSLLSQSLVFTPRVTDFTPFLLPAQAQKEIRIEADPQGGGFSLPFNFDLFDVGVLGVSIGVVFTATPETISIVRGISLNTEHDGDLYTVTDPFVPNSMYLYANEGYMDLETTYELDVTTQIGYRFVGSGGLTIRVLGSDIPISIEFLNQYVNLFAGVERPQYGSGVYTHDLPVASSQLQRVRFGTIEIGTSQTITFPINNDGGLVLDAQVGYEGDAQFSVSPPVFVVDPGGQDAAIVTFAPNDVGEYEGELIFYTSDPLQPELRVPVTGKAVRPDATTPGIDDNGTDIYSDGGPSTVYDACGCDAGTWTPRGMAPFAFLLPLLLVRRREDD